MDNHPLTNKKRISRETSESVHVKNAVKCAASLSFRLKSNTSKCKESVTPPGKGKERRVGRGRAVSTGKDLSRVARNKYTAKWDGKR